ncbi:MAG TPA: hypothetical protein VFX89_14740 [Gammaproteobacteria bacterium]|nr:hypothetical protein [Gammaproteobacteria bacterium]
MPSSPDTPSTPGHAGEASREAPAPLADDRLAGDGDDDGAADASPLAEAIVIRRLGPWAVEHEPESDSYLLIDAAGGFCADLHWNERGECWAQFEPYVAFSGATTIADIESVAKLAELLRSFSPPAGRAPKNNPLR